MTDYLTLSGIKIEKQLANFIEQEVLAGLNETPGQVWSALSVLVAEFTERNQALLEKRQHLQDQIDDWFRENKSSFDPDAYERFLRSINYIVDDGGDFEITTNDVDDEIALMAGPQLVVPVSNARFALNALNARYGSLYDAIYSSDFLLDPLDGNAPYSESRGRHVVDFCRQFLDATFSIDGGSHVCAEKYYIDEHGLAVLLEDGKVHRLKNAKQYAGYIGQASRPSTIVLRNNKLHVLIEIDNESPVGKVDKAGVKDIIVESALTTIQDFEDSVAAVDAQDKVTVYRNWLGLMKGDLQATFKKNGKELVRRSVVDKEMINQYGDVETLRARSLLLCRNVGLLMTNPMVLDANGNEVYEGIVDGIISVLIAKHDLQREPNQSNSRSGSVYIVKPKMHGPEEAAFTNDLFDRIEGLLGLEQYTVKVGVMDEERRTSVNLKECVRSVKNRVAFINTGFLDRTGDEIHTSMLFGPFAEKAQIKNEAWYSAYENANVEIGLTTGFSTHAQIGKGMWAKPDEMRQMSVDKIQHLNEGATTAWVPSPLAASLHALHYHKVDVYDVHDTIPEREKASLTDLLTVPLLTDVTGLTDQQIQSELDNNAQGILGYVVRWVDQGVGCSKVPDITGTNLMEDRATLRISSQHIANWLLYGLVSKDQIQETFTRMAKVVDDQNKNDPNYRPMTLDIESNLAFQAALDLVLKGCQQPNGYTEPLLHRYRQLAKKAQL